MNLNPARLFRKPTEQESWFSVANRIWLVIGLIRIVFTIRDPDWLRSGLKIWGWTLVGFMVILLADFCWLCIRTLWHRRKRNV